MVRCSSLPWSIIESIVINNYVRQAIIFELADVVWSWQGLRTISLQSIGSATAVPSPKSGEEEEQAKCDPNKAIPLHYHPLHEKSSSSSATAAPTLPPDVDMPACKGHAESDHSSDVLLCSPCCHSSMVTWQVQLKALLLRKACIVCYKLAREQLNSQVYGTALNFARQALYCFGEFEIANHLWDMVINFSRCYARSVLCEIWFAKLCLTTYNWPTTCWN